jgi:hypothetical protein
MSKVTPRPVIYIDHVGVRALDKRSHDPSHVTGNINRNIPALQHYMEAFPQIYNCYPKLLSFVTGSNLSSQRVHLYYNHVFLLN